MSLVVMAGAARAASASSLTLDGTFVKLDQDFTVPGFFTGDWSWTSSDVVKFDLTDYLVVGDGFAVFDNGGATPVATFNSKPDWSVQFPLCGLPTDPSCGWTNDPLVALANPAFNQGTLFFAPGAHDITIEALTRPSDVPDANGVPQMFPDSTVAFRATDVPAAVPEPASMALLGSGLVGLALRRRKARQS